MVQLRNKGTSPITLVRGVRQLVTLRGEGRPRRGSEMRALGIIPDGAMLISGGVILEVGSARRVERLAEARGAEEIDLSGKVVVPGFVDTVTRLLHPVGADLHEQDHARGDQEPALHTSAMLRKPTAQRLELDAVRRLRQAARHGTLTAACSPGWDADERATWKALRVMAGLPGGPVRLVPAMAVRTQDSLELLARVRRGRLAATASIDGRAEGSGELARRARQLGFSLRIHGAPELAVEHGAGMVAGQVDWTEGRIEALRRSDAVWVTLPVVDWLRGVTPAALRERIDDGVAIALSTGFGLNANATVSMSAVMSLACISQRLTPAEALTATTINAACALGIGHEAGSLMPRKRADFVVFDTTDYREPILQLGSNLVCGYMASGIWHAPRRSGKPAEPALPERRAS